MTRSPNTITTSFLVLAFLAFCMSLGFSQITTEDEIIRDVNSDIIYRNEGVINQIGDQNAAVVYQWKIGRNANLAEVLQSGDANIVLMAQVGSNNFTKVDQIGNGNVYELLLTGLDNNVQILQEGNNNTISQQLLATQLNNIKIIQQGNNNQVWQVQVGDVPDPNIQIRQVGDNLQLVIRHGGSY